MKKWHTKHVENEDYIFIDAKVANPLNPKHKLKVQFLVDTGANGCAISQKLAEELNLKPAGFAEVKLADNSVVKACLTNLIIEIAGKKILTQQVIFGPGFTEILGNDVLSAFEIQVDVKRRKVLIPINRFSILRIFMDTNMNPVYLEAPTSFQFSVQYGEK